MATAKSEPSEVNAVPKAAPKPSVVMVVLLLIFFLGTSDNQMISPLLPLIAKDFGLDVGRVGELMGPAYALAAASAALLVGPVSDKFGRRRFLLYASILFGLSLVPVYFVGSVQTLAALRLLAGLAAGTFSTCSIAYVGDYFPYERRGVAMSVVQAGYFLALVLGVPVANLLAQWQTWRVSFVFFGLVSIVAFLLVFALLPEDKHLAADQDLSERVERRFHNIRIIFESRERVAAIAVAFLVSAGFVGFIFYLGSWLTKSMGLRPRDINLVFILFGVASLIGAVAAGPIADRFGKRGLSILSTLVLASMLLLIPGLSWGVALFVSFSAASLAFAFRQGPLQALATELVPRRVRGAFVAVRNTASQIGIAVSTAVSGMLYDGQGYWAVGIFSGVLTLIAAAFIFLMREPQKETAGTNRS